MESNSNIKKSFTYGIADFKDSKIIILTEPSDNSDIIEDPPVKNPLNFDQIINTSNKKYISYITISGIRRYSLIEENNNSLASIKLLDAKTYMWNIFKIYKSHYIDNYIKPENANNTKKSLSIFIKTLYNNLQPKSIHLCAQFTHWALNVAGFKFQGKYSAKLYHMEGLLKELGFYEIDKKSELKKGDIAVIVIDDLKDIEDYYGHICAWDGNYWLCDYKTDNLKYKKFAHFYRFDNWDD